MRLVDSSVLDLLEDPGVAVGVAEVGERVVVGCARVRARACQPLGVMWRISLDLDAAPDELGPRGLDVGDDEVRAAVGAGRRVGDALPIVSEQAEPGGVSWTTRNSSSGWWSTSRLKPDCLDVEVLGAVDVRDGDRGRARA